MTLNYSRFRSTSSKFFFFVSNNARCFLNTLHVGSSINCGRKRNARRIRTELEKDTWLTAMKKSGGGRETWPNKMSDRDPTNEKKGQHAWREYRKRRIEWHWSVDWSNVCEKFYLFDHRHVYYFIPSNSYFSFENK